MLCIRCCDCYCAVIVVASVGGIDWSLLDVVGQLWLLLLCGSDLVVFVVAVPVLNGAWCMVPLVVLLTIYHPWPGTSDALPKTVAQPPDLEPNQRLVGTRCIRL